MTPPRIADALDGAEVAAVAAEFRDWLTSESRGPLVYPMVFDVITSTPGIANAFARRLSAHLARTERPLVDEPQSEDGE